MGDDGMKGWEEDIGKYDDEALDLHQTRLTSCQSLRQAKMWRAAKNLDCGTEEQGPRTRRGNCSALAPRFKLSMTTLEELPRYTYLLSRKHHVVSPESSDNLRSSKSLSNCRLYILPSIASYLQFGRVRGKVGRNRRHVTWSYWSD